MNGRGMVARETTESTSWSALKPFWNLCLTVICLTGLPSLVMAVNHQTGSSALLPSTKSYVEFSTRRSCRGHSRILMASFLAPSSSRMSGRSKVDILVKSVRTQEQELDNRRRINISSTVELPFAPEAAYDAFSNLPRQPSWSPWLRSVDYITEDGTVVEEQTKLSRWTLKLRGIQFSWTSQATANERPNLIQWESTSGLKNFGTVRFKPIQEDSPSNDDETSLTEMTLTLSIIAPRILYLLFRRSNRIQHLVENKMIRPSMEDFRDIVVREDLSKIVKN